jgi:hypothetical protein
MKAPGLASQLTARKRPLPVTALAAWHASPTSGMPSPSLSVELKVRRLPRTVPTTIPGGLALTE